MIPLCSCCTSPSSRVHQVTDDRGTVWRFENHPFFGPLILRADDEPKVRQPGSRSRFWTAYQTWVDARKAA